jgi:hypothetical protein
MFNPIKYDKFIDKCNGENGYSLNTLLAINNNSGLKYPKQVDILLNYISTNIFERVKKITNDSRKILTQIWFLPPNNIQSLSRCLERKIMNHIKLTNYLVYSVNRKDIKQNSNIKEEIRNLEEKVILEKKEGLIILAGSMLNLGITLNYCDLVILMHDTASSDRIIQQIFRCMTEGVNKKYGIVVDVNINRIVNTVLNITRSNPNKCIDRTLNYLIHNNIIKIDPDYILEQNDSNTVVNKLLNIWKSDPTNSYKYLLRNIGENIAIDNDTQIIIDKVFSKTEFDKIIMTRLKDDKNKDVQELPTGHIRICDKIEGMCEKDKEEKKDNKINFTTDVLVYIIPLACIITLDNQETDILNMLNLIKQDKELTSIFNDQCKIWWNNNNIIDLIIDILSKFTDKKSNIYIIALNLKLTMISLIDDKKKLLNLIKEHLTPKELEKAKYGEVFTPLDIIEEMLDKLPPSIWSDKNTKFFDPASGIGNFEICIYYRLIESLKISIPDKKMRKKHIFENMIYVSEFNKKNITIYKRIFDRKNKYKLNIHRGDTLKADIQKYFNIDKFDVIVGNPPFNSEGIKSYKNDRLSNTGTSKSIWHKFILKSLNLLKENKYLVFINPLSWLRESHKIHTILLHKKILWMKLLDHVETKKKFNVLISISAYVLQNTNINYRYRTTVISNISNKNINTTSKAYLDPNASIPLAYFSVFDKLKTFIKNNNLDLTINTRTVVSMNNKKIKLPEKYKLSDNYAVDTYTILEGIIVKKVAIKHPDADKKKIIIASKSNLSGMFIDNGKLSLTGTHKYYILGKNLKIQLKFMKYKIFKIVCDLIKYGQCFLDLYAFKYIPDIRKYEDPNISEEDFYKTLRLTDLEIKNINSF